MRQESGWREGGGGEAEREGGEGRQGGSGMKVIKRSLTTTTGEKYFSMTWCGVHL